MKALAPYLLFALALAPLASRAAAPETRESPAARAQLANRVDVLERAAQNREVAGLTQLGHARQLELLAHELQNGDAREDETEAALNKRVGELHKKAAVFCGLAAANIDMAVANLSRAGDLCGKIGRSEQKNSAHAKAAALKSQADDAIALAGAASEKAAVAYDKAGETAEVAAASQQAAVWLEMLAAR